LAAIARVREIHRHTLGGGLSDLPQESPEEQVKSPI